MTVRFNVKNKVTINAVFRTTFPVAIGIGSVIGTPIFTHRHEWPFAVPFCTPNYDRAAAKVCNSETGLDIVTYTDKSV